MGAGYLASRWVGMFRDPELGLSLVSGARGPGNALVLYTPTGSGARLMEQTAESAANLLGTNAVAANDGAGILHAVDMAPSNISRTILIGHGTASSFVHPSTGGLHLGADVLPAWISVRTFVSHLAPKLAPSDVILSFAGCRAGADSDEENWTNASDIAGGENSLAAAVRDEIVRVRGSMPNSEVRAKSTTGTSFGNPMGRVFPIDTSFVGRPGIPLVDLVWGPGSAANPEIARAWRNAGRAEAKMAMGWTIGGDAPQAERTA